MLRYICHEYEVVMASVAQVEQLKSDNIVSSSPSSGDEYASFEQILDEHGNTKLTSVHEILPTSLSET